MKNSAKRNAARILHIAAGCVLASYIYSPWGENHAFQIATKAIVIPLTIISGLWLWKGHLFSNLIGGKSKVPSIIAMCLLGFTSNAQTDTVNSCDVDPPFSYVDPLKVGIKRKNLSWL